MEKLVNDNFFGNLIQSTREKRGLSRVELGKKICMPGDVIFKIEKGIYKCSIDKFIFILKVLNVKKITFNMFDDKLNCIVERSVL